MRISQRKVTWCFFNFGHRSLYLIPSIACNCLPVSWLLITKTLTFLNFSWARSQKCPSVHLSVRQNLPWFLFCRFILMVNSCIWSHFGLKSDILPFLGSSMAEICIFEHFCDIVGTRSPVTVLFKFSSVSIFGDSREISLHVWRIFPKFSVWGPHKPSENG